MVFKPAAVAQKRLPVPTGHNAVLQQGEMYVANGSVSGGAGGQVTGYRIQKRHSSMVDLGNYE